MGFDCDAARARLGSTPLDDGSVFRGLRPLFGPRFRWADSAPPSPAHCWLMGPGGLRRGGVSIRRARAVSAEALAAVVFERPVGASGACRWRLRSLRRPAPCPTPRRGPIPLRPAQGWTLAFSRSASGIRPGRPRSSRASAIVNAVGMGGRIDSIAWRHEMCRKRGGLERRPRGDPGMAIYLLAARRRSDRRRVP